MTTDRRSHLTALALALFVTVSIFSGVSQLAAPTHAGQQLAQMTSPAPSNS